MGLLRSSWLNIFGWSVRLCIPFACDCIPCADETPPRDIIYNFTKSNTLRGLLALSHADNRSYGTTVPGQRETLTKT